MHKHSAGNVKGRGWHESPDASGKAPEHRDAKLRAQAKGACNIPMVKNIEPFDITLKTEYSSWDRLLSNTGISEKRTMGFGENQHEVLTYGRIEQMTPIEYLRRSFKTFRNSKPTDEWIDELVKDVLERNVHLLNTIDASKVNRYAQEMKNGKKFPIPVLDMGWSYQEGNHRALAAEKIGIRKIPVLVIENAPQGKQIHSGIRTLNKDLKKLAEEGYENIGIKRATPIANTLIITAKKVDIVLEPKAAELYRASFKSESSKILKNGILPKKPTYTGRFGIKLNDLGTVYAFTKFDDAVRWASKMQFDFKKPTIIVTFRGNIGDWEQDTHFESAGAKGEWLKKKGVVLPEDIIEITNLSQEMTKAIVQTLGTSKELTRIHGIVEMK